MNRFNAIHYNDHNGTNKGASAQHIAYEFHNATSAVERELVEAEESLAEIFAECNLMVSPT